MGKTNKKKVEAIRAKKARKDKLSNLNNPFEVKVNRQKFSVLGKKVMKHEKGMPGVSKAKAMEKRESTLLVELKNKDRVGSFQDRRIGVPSDNAEEVMARRYAKERMVQSKKASRFNLQEGEALTHYGQSLAEIERFEAPVASDDDDDDDDEMGDKGRLGAEFGDELFGGFLKEKEQTESYRTWKERMEALITKTRRERYERQKERDKTLDMTEQLDADWKLLSGQLGKQGHYRDGEDEGKRDRDAKDFDMAVSQFKFEARATATERVKSQEEIAAEEKTRLEKLEAARRKRMTGEDEEEAKKKRDKKKIHFSADALEDDYLVEDVRDDKSRVVMYDENGRLIQPSSDDDDSDEDGEEQGGEEEGSGSDDEEEGSDEDEEAADSDEDDDFSDVAASDDDDDAPAPKRQRTAEEEGEQEMEEEGTKEEKLKRKKEKMEAAKSELPYTFPAPTKYQELLDLLEGRGEADQLAVVERLRKLHHVSLADGNRQKLETLFGLLLQYVCELGKKDPPPLATIDRLTPQLWHLAQVSPTACGGRYLALLDEKMQRFSDIMDIEKGRGLMPTLDVLVLLKVGSALFPTSDKRHPVTTPVCLFLSRILTQCPVRYMRDLAVGLFVCNLVLEYVAEAKRWFPEVITFLHSIVAVAAPADRRNESHCIPPFKPGGKCGALMQLEGRDLSNASLEKMRVSQVLVLSKAKSLENDVFRLQVLRWSIELLKRFHELYRGHASCPEIFAPSLALLPLLPSRSYPAALKELIAGYRGELERSRDTRQLTKLAFKKRRPQALTTFTPRFDEKFTDGKKKSADRAQEDRRRLQQKVKQEHKGALRDIRRDRQALNRHQIQTTLDKDAVRKQKVAKIHQQLAQQEGDFRALKRRPRRGEKKDD